MIRPVISVIIPVYNGEKTIRRCLDSILDQTFKNIEIIVINDKSTDQTLKILKEYKDDIVLIENKRNLGLSPSRNKGLKIARGEYITFVDSDDYINENMYEDMVALMTDDVDLVTCYRYDITKNGVEEIEIYSPDNKKICNRYLYVWNKLFKKSIIDKYNLKFVPYYAEDYVFIMQYNCYIRNSASTSKSYYYYDRQSSNSISNYISNTSEDKKLESIKSLTIVAELYKKNKKFEEYENEIFNISISYYLKRIIEFKYYPNTYILRKFTKMFLKYFKKYFKNYKKRLSTYKSSTYRIYRSNYFFMILYVMYKQFTYRKSKRKELKNDKTSYFSNSASL